MQGKLSKRQTYKRLVETGVGARTWSPMSACLALHALTFSATRIIPLGTSTLHKTHKTSHNSNLKQKFLQCTSSTPTGDWHVKYTTRGEGDGPYSDLSH